MGRSKLNPAGEHSFKARLPLEIWEALCRSAEDQRRSINAQLIWLLQQQLTSQRKPKK